MHEFIAALRQLRFPIVALAIAILVLQTLVGGLASGHAAAGLATGDIAAGLFCHGNGPDGGAPSHRLAHDCCKSCTSAGPAALSPELVSLGTLDVPKLGQALAPPRDRQLLPRAIRAGPSQAPPMCS